MKIKAWFGNKLWPSARSLKEFAEDVFRLENCNTDKEKALAFYKWFIRCAMHGPNLNFPNNMGGYTRYLNPLIIFTSGHNDCVANGYIASEALNAAGLKARRVAGIKDSNGMPGHTIYEVFYKGIDNKESWHAFDPAWGGWYLNRHNEIASCDELAKDPLLVHDPIGHATPKCWNIDRCNLPSFHAWHDAIYVDQFLFNERLSYNMLPGQSYTNLYRPAEPDRILFYNNDFPNGSHCRIKKFNHKGKLTFPLHEPFWSNYRFNILKGIQGEHNAVRTHGTGALRWQPLKYGERCTYKSSNAVFERNTLRPTYSNAHCEVIYEIETPYIFAALEIEGYVRDNGNYMGISVSRDDYSFVSLKQFVKGRFRVMNNKNDLISKKSSVQYSQKLYIKIDLNGSDTQMLPVLETLNITAAYQHNMFTQPFILPGQNNFYIENNSDQNAKLIVEFNFTLNGNEKTIEFESNETGIKEKKEFIDFQEQKEITMRGVSIRYDL